MRYRGPHEGKPGASGEPGEPGRGGRGGTGGTGGAGGRGGSGAVANRWSLIGYLVLAAGVVFGFTVGYHKNQQLQDAIERNRQASVALCAEKAGLHARIDRTQKLLEQNPGPTVFGIPRIIIAQGLHDDQATAKDYAILQCPPPPTP